MKRIREKIPDKKQTYTTGWVEKHAASKQVKRRAHYLQHIIEKLCAKTILDVGCASGAAVDILRRAGFQATGIDSEINNIAYANLNMQGRFIQGDAGNLPEDNQYDVVISTHLLEHMPSPDKAVKEMKKVCSDQGYVIISVPNALSYSDKSLWRRSTINLINDPNHLWAFTPYSLYSLITENGFSIVQVITTTDLEVIIIGIMRTVAHWLLRKPLNEANSDDAFQALASDKTNDRIHAVVEKVCDILRPLHKQKNNLEGVELTIVAQNNSR